MAFQYYDNDHIPLTVLELSNGNSTPPASITNGHRKGSITYLIKICRKMYLTII